MHDVNDALNDLCAVLDACEHKSASYVPAMNKNAILKLPFQMCGGKMLA